VNKQRSHRFHMEGFNLKKLNEVEGNVKKLIYPRTWPWRSIGLWDVKNPTISRRSAHR
jgi:hypothetical protein